MNKKQQQQSHAWLRELTSLPSAAGKEDRVIAWVERWVRRRPDLSLARDNAGNLILRQKRAANSREPWFLLTAHLDHPTFVVVEKHNQRDLVLEFRGGVLDPYFPDAQLEIVDQHNHSHRARVVEFNPQARPFKRVTARMSRDGDMDSVAVGDLGRWWFPGHRELPRVVDGLLHTHACDDLAALAGALTCLDHARHREELAHLTVLLTRAEEVGTLGAIAACEEGTIPRDALVVCLENSRSFADSPIGDGPILRVGDRATVFDPRLTNALGDLLWAYQKESPHFRWQRKLMAGGVCEATVFSGYGYATTCVCLPLGNYHNMSDIDGVIAGKRPALVAPEVISLQDYDGMIELLLLCATRLGEIPGEPSTERFTRLLKNLETVLWPERGNGG